MSVKSRKYQEVNQSRKSQLFSNLEIFFLLYLIDNDFSNTELAKLAGCSDEFIRLLKLGRVRKKQVRQYEELTKLISCRHPKPKPIVVIRADE